MITWPSRRTLLVAAGLLVAVLVVGGGATLWYLAAQRAASAAYGEALTLAQRSHGPGGDPAAAAGRLEATLAQYPSGRRAADAAYELGNLRYAQRQYGA